MRTPIGLVACLALMGVGCSKPPNSLRTVLPEINIISPANNIETSQATIGIIGSTNVLEVYINNIPRTVLNGQFTAPIELQLGKNAISAMATTGYSTTTLILNVTRI